MHIHLRVRDADALLLEPALYCLLQVGLRKVPVCRGAPDFEIYLDAAFSVGRNSYPRFRFWQQQRSLGNYILQDLFGPVDIRFVAHTEHAVHPAQLTSGWIDHHGCGHNSVGNDDLAVIVGVHGGRQQIYMIYDSGDTVELYLIALYERLGE